MQSKMGPIQMSTLEQELDPHLSSLERKRGQSLSGSPGPRVKRKEQQRLEREQTGTVLRRAGACAAGRCVCCGCGGQAAGGTAQDSRMEDTGCRTSCFRPHPAPKPANFCLKDPFPRPSPTGIELRPAETGTENMG